MLAEQKVTLQEEAVGVRKEELVLLYQLINDVK